MSLRDQLVSTAKAYLDAHNALDVDAINELCSPSCTHRGGPVSIAQPTRSNDEYTAFNRQVFPMFLTYHAETLDTIVDDKSRKVALFLHTKATAAAGSYENEYIITLTMTDDGKLVQDQYDFIDSHTMMEWISKLGGGAKDTWDN